MSGQQDTMTKKELHIAPMLNYSHRDFRALLRILSKRAVLWTEMVVDETMLNAKELETHLGYDRVEHPIVCQIGGNRPELAALCAQIIARDYDYDEVNINCGCPSDKVANEQEFGAALMKNAELVKSMVSAMRQEVDIPISVKTRIGIMGEDDELINTFITTLQPVCSKFTLHARQVHLNGLNARQNRNIPPLNYHLVYDLCRQFPDCDFSINGGIKNLKDARLLCFGEQSSTDDDVSGTVPSNLRGCMLGRAAVDNPSFFWDVDRYFYGELDNPCHTRREVLIKYVQYVEHTYPRRCCDDDERVTYLYPPPQVDVPRNKYCIACESVYSDTVEQFGDGLTLRTKEEMAATRRNSSNEADDYAAGKQQFQRRCPGVKVSSRVIGRALKPVENLFAGMPCSKAFRVSLQARPSHNNCGPGFILRSVMQSTPNRYLDVPFVKTEDDPKPACNQIKNREARTNKSSARSQKAQ